eukprot:m.227820 g.227820  ORF g.227820 m.227820 type:complete len:143 (-) comp11648_c0_seq1:91-519(-)
MAAMKRGLGLVFVQNRNPRSLELQGLQLKPKGYGTTHHDAPMFFHRLYLTLSNKHTSAFVEGADREVLFGASTQEPCVAQHLYSCSDKCAAQNIGKIIGQRCLESGITHVHWDIGLKKYHGKVKHFIDAVRKEGVSLKEPGL